MSGKNTNKAALPSLKQLMATQNPLQMQVLMATLALANSESNALISDVLRGSGPIGTVSQGDPMGAGEAFREVGNSLARNPTALMNANMELMQGWMQLWQEMATEALSGDTPPVRDKRFADPEWENNPSFKFIRKAYEVNSKWLMGLADHAPDIPDNIHLRAKFFTQQLTDTLSPTNYLGTNPQALRAFIETGGESVLNGIRLARADVKKAGGKLHISQTDETPFELGKNIATAPGKVVFRNDLIELIQYAPTQETVYSRPLLIFPPWINKFYILDLREENSMIRWLVDKGLTVFVVSWRSADEVTKDYTWDDYSKNGVYAAVEAALQASGSKKLNAVGYCIGGTLLSGTLAHMAANGDDRVAAATFFASQSDFELAGDLKVFTDGPGRGYIDSVIEENGGVMPGAMMYETFNWLRPIDLVWRYVIDQYMLGKTPRPFDLLYWNADQTNIPGKVHKRYLRDCYSKNKLSRGKFKLFGEKVNLKDVKIPVMVQASRDDHICPFESVYRTATVFGGDTKFVLSGSGHIAGVVNHPDSNKYQHWTGGDITPTGEEWLETAEEHPGSWWPYWWDWLKPKSGSRKKAAPPKDMGLGDAPGSYVRVRLQHIKLPLE
ncbi:PHA/PHB synthase family protein [Hyphomonas johnsonii]|jgi:polyhydroxyalkanoate synthase|uniref:PHA/PHB synthase family protein n=1 Tax=Hyphomonas johnsonii MHS-2 TaxID=1280950 RepID=A0A059FUS8_9PROT|nr:class I poly(R)-hydroxyalkanoic acid synthase [Hyphomonas johnsonii]KCZ94419.1 PHA/PHB synthase family protein [Hyphomonas johnsonii MHS-2]